MYDPDFGDIPEKRPPTEGADINPWKVILWLLLAPVLVLVGPYLVMIVLILVKPFTQSDRLDRPVIVKATTEKELILTDGRHITLPFIKRIPKDEPVFRSVLEGGVEIDRKGHAFGLLTVYPSCGMTAYRYYTHRVNMSDLAGSLDPSGIDDSLIEPEEIEFIKDIVHAPTNPHRVNDYFLGGVYKVRQIREHYESNPIGPRAVAPSPR